MDIISNTQKIEELLGELPPGSQAKMRHVLERLFRLPRTGWKDRKIKSPETVGEHTYAMYLIANEHFQGLGPMIVIHDAAESDPTVGDIRTDNLCPQERRWTKENKRIAETRAMIDICTDMGQGGKTIFYLFYEYERQESWRAKIVKQIDRLQVIMKATEYELSGELVEATEFDASLIREPVLVQILKKTLKELEKAH